MPRENSRSPFFESGRVVKFDRRNTRYRDLPEDKQVSLQLARFFHSAAALAEVAALEIDRIAGKLFASRPNVDGARGLLAEIRWRSMSEESIAARLGRCTDATIDVLLRAVFEALRSGPPCDHGIEFASVYHYNAEFRRLMARLPAFRSWLARDFSVVASGGESDASQFVGDILRMLDGELRRLVKAGYMAGDTVAHVPYHVYLHKTMPHLGFLVVDFPKRPEVLEMNQSTASVVGEFAYAGEALVRAGVLPGEWFRQESLGRIPDISTRCTKVAIARLARHLFLAVDDSVQAIDEVFERIFVTSFLEAAVPGTQLGRTTASTFERRKWSNELSKQSTESDFEPVFDRAFMRTQDSYAGRNWDDLVRDPSPGGRVVRPFAERGIEPTLNGYRTVFYTHFHWTRRLLLGWHADGLLADRAIAESVVHRTPPAGDIVKTKFQWHSKAAGGLVQLFHYDEVHDVTAMNTTVYFLPDFERGTVRIVVTGTLEPAGGPRGGYELRPVEVNLPMIKKG